MRTVVVVEVATPCSLPSVLQLLEETSCLFSNVLIYLRTTRSLQSTFKIHGQYNVFIRSQNKYRQTQLFFAFILKTVSKTKEGFFPPKFCIFDGIIMNRRLSCFLNVILDLLIIHGNFDLFLLLPYNARTPLFLTNFSRQFLHCGAVWTLKFADRDTSYTKAVSQMQFCQVSPKLQEISGEP